MWTGEVRHVPVLMGQVLEALAPRPGVVMVDATFGGGGYSRALLAAAPCRVVGIDRDPQAVERGRELAAAEPRFTMIEGRFGDMAELLADAGFGRVQGIALDLGVSSFQLDEAARGFSFARSGPLDMHMSRQGPTAADLLATVSDAELTRVLRELGDEPDARRVARAIVRRRDTAPLTRTEELAATV